MVVISKNGAVSVSAYFTEEFIRKVKQALAGLNQLPYAVCYRSAYYDEDLVALVATKELALKICADHNKPGKDDELVVIYDARLG